MVYIYHDNKQDMTAIFGINVEIKEKWTENSLEWNDGLLLFWLFFDV